jgi:CspA family cold shock protein
MGGEMSEVLLGQVKWFSDSKGIGFIRVVESGTEVFVHYSQVHPQPNGFRTLQEGQRVRFNLCEGPKGLFAVDVVGLEVGK